MHIIHETARLRATLERTRPLFIPTMGNLHEGHLDLVRRARSMGGPVVVSIFVNRLQFAPHEDFDRYPRTLERDCALLAAEGCDVVFAPDERELYPEPQTFRVVPAAELADILEGSFRPGFFTGVCTVVAKLFQCVQPAIAVFGQKDFQQLRVVQAMVRQLAMPVQVIGVETRRDPDGLALSSRNGYLTAAERSEAVALPRALRGLADAVLPNAQGDPEALQALEASALENLRARGWQPDYLTVRCHDTLQPPTALQLQAGVRLVALGAARLGRTRLIDNVPVGAQAPL